MKAERTKKTKTDMRPPEYRRRKLLKWPGKIQIICVAAGLILGGAAQAAARMEVELPGGTLARPGYGQEEEQQVVLVDGLVPGETVPVEIRLSGRAYGEEEARRACERALEQLPELIRGENPSLNQVRTDLNLIGSLDDSGFRLRWDSGDSLVVDSFGQVNNEDVPDEGAPVDLSVEFTDGTHSETYVLPVLVLPPAAGPREKTLRSFSAALQEADLAQQNTPWLKLPAAYGGQKLRYRLPAESPFWSLAALGAVAAVLLTAKEHSDAEKARQKRENQLLLDYPEVVSKLMIFLGAGMTVRTAWERITGDYRELLKRGKRTVRYAYEEMYETSCQMGRGVPEGEAYGAFGRRCGLLPYMKLAGILEQNRKNGSKNVRELLKAEMADAFELRKHGARRMGEEAGTRLLLPLFLMLGVVMVMVAVPAMMEFM